MELIKRLEKENLISPPKWLANNTAYATIMGSVAYEISNDYSDIDIYGFALPKKEDLFPHLRGEILGFGTQIQKFEQYQQHGIINPDKKDSTYDITIFSIVKYFQLAMENNPNILDSLFVPSKCIQHITPVGQIVRDNRKLFLHKGSFPKMKGYAYSQIHKMKIKNPQEGSKRWQDVQKHGFDLKFAVHVVRLLGEAEQILLEGNLDLTKNKEQLKSIRRGEWTQENVEEYFNQKEKDLETLYTNSQLQVKPNENKIKQILLSCLEEHYGDLSSAVVNVNAADEALAKIKEIVNKF